MGDWTEWVVATASDLEGKKIVGNRADGKNEIDISAQAKKMRLLDFKPHHDTWGWRADPDEFDDEPEALAANKQWLVQMDILTKTLLKEAIGEDLALFRVGLRGDEGKFMFYLTRRGYAHDGACKLVQVLGSFGVRAIALSHDEMVMGPEYVRPLAWTGVPVELVESYRRGCYEEYNRRFARDYAYVPIAEMEESDTHGSTGIYGLSSKRGVLTYERIRGEQPLKEEGK